MCCKPEIVNLFFLQKNDMRSVFGRNCANICREFKFNNMSNIKPKHICMPALIDDTLTWQMPLLHDLISLRNNPGDIPDKDILSMINNVCWE